MLWSILLRFYYFYLKLSETCAPRLSRHLMHSTHIPTHMAYKLIPIYFTSCIKNASAPRSLTENRLIRRALLILLSLLTTLTRLIYLLGISFTSIFIHNNEIRLNQRLECAKSTNMLLNYYIILVYIYKTHLNSDIVRLWQISFVGHRFVSGSWVYSHFSIIITIITHNCDGWLWWY